MNNIPVSFSSRFSRYGAALQENRRIVLALLLQDMKTRFGRNYFSYFVAVAWPLTHVGFMMAGYLLMNNIAPVGDNPAIFAATGMLPYILCFYPGRVMPMIYLQNKQLLNIPIIRPFHIICAGFIIEIITACIIFTILLFTISIFGVNIYPIDNISAISAIIATLYMAIGIGVFNVTCSAIFGSFYVLFYVMIMIGLYVTSGVYVPRWMVPESTRVYIQYNPLLNLVEWLRSAYYASYDPDLINKPLVLGTATVALFLGLVGERFLRNKFLT